MRAMKANILHRIINRILMRHTAVSRYKECSDTVYITFDDGPEPGITEFVLDQLDKYNCKATFFCTGANAELYPELMESIRARGHAIGNHSYQHKHAYELDNASYVEDIQNADAVLHTELFRPPNGCVKFGAWRKLKHDFKIVYWSIASGDWRKETYDAEECKSALSMAKPGDIILFHFVKDFDKATRELLPWFLELLKQHGYKAAAIKL